MPNFQTIVLDTATPQLRAPGTGDGYSFNSGATNLGVWTTTGLGIGTSSPSNGAKLDAAGAIISTAATLSSFNANNAGFDFIAASKIGRFFATSTDTTGGTMTFTTGQNGTYQTRMTILNDGNLGIGTTSPAVRLHVQGSAGQIMRVTDGTTGASIYSGGGLFGFNNQTGEDGMFGSTASHFLYFATNGSERMRLDSSGNVGIGVTPSAWSQGRALEILNAGYGLWNGSGSPEASIYLTAGAVFNGGFKYSATSARASHYYQFQGAHVWSTAPAGTAGNAITFTQAMTLDASSVLLLGNTSNYGVGSFEANSLQARGPIVLAANNTGSADNRNWIFQANAAAAGAFSLAYSSTNTGWPNAAYAMVVDRSGNLGLGVTPSAWGTVGAFQLKASAALFGFGNSTYLTQNHVYDGSTSKYITTGYSQLYEQNRSLGVHAWYTAPSGTAGNTISFTQAMTLDASGNLGVGTTSPSPYTANGRVIHVDGGANAAELKLTNNTSGASGVTGATFIMQGNDFYIWNVENSFLSLGTNNAERARITSDGNLALGSTSILGSTNRASFTNTVSAKGVLALQSTSTSGYSATELYDSAGTQQGAMGWGNSAVAVTGAQSAIYLYSTGPITFLAGGTTERARIPAAGGFVVGTAALATTATDGFLYIPGCAGTPTGVPTALTGRVPLVVDTTNNKLYFYSGGAWRDAGP